MLHRFEVVNIKCGGCARSIDKALRATLLRLGYPETGSAAGLQALAAKGKSFVSCAVGRFGGK